MINHSFAVMAYKNSPYLAECLDSLKKQTVESAIYIATSTPSEYINDLAKKYKVQVFVIEPGKGITHDWNFSLKNAKTKYVTLAHQDDTYMPDYAESCFNAAEKFKDTLICFTDYSEIINEKDRSSTLMLRIKRFMLWSFMPLKKNIRSKFWKRVSVSMGSPIPCPGVMYNLNNLSTFEFSEQFSINLDWDAWYRMSKMNGRFVYAPSVLLKHRIHSDSETTVGLKTNIRQTEDLKMFTMFWPKFIARVFAKLYARSYKSNTN